MGVEKERPGKIKGYSMHLRVYVPLPELYELNVSNVEGLMSRIKEDLFSLKKQQKLDQSLQLKRVTAKTKSNSMFSSESQDTDLMNLTGPIPEIVEENGKKIVNAYVETMTGGRRKSRKTRKNKRV